MRRPILCRLGIHKIETGYYLQITKRRGAHKWRRNYGVCSRCGRFVFVIRKRKEAAP